MDGFQFMSSIELSRSPMITGIHKLNALNPTWPAQAKVCQQFDVERCSLSEARAIEAAVGKSLVK